jgi:hypothetical protein
MKLKGQEVEESIKDWIKSEIKVGPSRGYDLGKYFFSVSTGTIGVLIMIEKLNPTTKIGAPLIASMLILFISVLLAICMTKPGIVSVGEDVDLLDQYEKSVRSIIKRVWWWFIIWIIGAFVGGYAVFQ